MKSRILKFSFLIIMFLSAFSGKSQEKDYSTIHFYSQQNCKNIFSSGFNFGTLMGVIKELKTGEALHCKIYSEGRFNFSGKILDIEKGRDYYLFQNCGAFTFGLSIYDSLDWIKSTKKMIGEFFVEEGKDFKYLSEKTVKRTNSGQGTCFLLSSTGYLITNYHVIDGAKEITIKGIDGDMTSKYGATVVASDKTNDLALLKLTNKNLKFDSLRYAIRSIGVQQGEKIFAMGFPIAFAMGDEVKLTEGVISAKSGVQGDISKFQVSATVTPGNSGGPLIDEEGNLVGVINAKSTIAESASYAIKANYLTTFLESIDGFQLPTFTNSIKDKTTPEKIAEWKKLVFIVETN